MLGAAGVQILENNLDDLQASREEDRTSEIVDPQDLLGLGVSTSRTIGFLGGTLAVVVILVKGHAVSTIVKVRPDNPQQKEYKEKAVIDSSCSMYMTRNRCYLDEYEDYDGGLVSFGDGKGRISSKGKIKTGTLDFKDVYFCKELKYNMFSVSQICDKKNNVLFTDTECLVLSFDFKLLDESQVLPKVLRKDNIYRVDRKSAVPTGDLTFLIAKDTIDESNTWHRRLMHINFKTINKLVKGNLVKGLPSKIFANDHSCVAYETSGILKTFITEIENQLDHKVKVIRSDNRTELKNSIMNQFCEIKGIKREFSVARTPQQNDVAERKNRTLIEAARTISIQSSKVLKIEKEILDQGLQDVDENEASDTSGKDDEPTRSESERLNQREMQTKNTNSTNGINTVSTLDSTARPTVDIVVPSPPVNTARPFVNTANAFEEHLFERFSPFKNAFSLPPVPNISLMDNTGIFRNAYDDEDVEEEVDMNNVNSSYIFPDTSFTKFHKDHLEDQVIGSLKTLVQTRHMTKTTEEHDLISLVHQLRRTNHKDFQNYLFACFLSQKEPKKNKARLVAQGHTQEEGIDYDEVFVPVARIEAIRLLLVYASFKDFVVYQMDVKSAFLYGKIEKDVYGQIYKTLFIRRHKDDILLVQVYVDDIIFGSTKKEMSTEFENLKKFDLASIKISSTPMETNKPLTKDEEAENVDVHLYRSMIGSLMYLTASRPDIMFVVCACARFQVIPKTSHLHDVKRIFSDYVGASLERKSTTRGSQFLGKRLISWQCKKQTIVANSTTKAKYVAAVNCYGQVLWIQNQMLDYGYNLMNTNIYIDNESTICIVKNPVSHSKTKHIEIRYHFIRDSYEKKLIQVIKTHTDKNVVDLLTKAFDVSRFNFLIASIGLLNL
ncbi:putative ribonuclease H-like domain-containing protein [Tanacetum coccineum]